MPDDALEALTSPCGTCGGASQVAWCPAWDAYLCVTCRSTRGDAELRVTLAAKAAMKEAATEERAA